MNTLIGYDITDTDKNTNQAQPQPVYFDGDSVSCEAYDYCYEIGEGEQFETVEQFVENATDDGWFKKS